MLSAEARRASTGDGLAVVLVLVAAACFVGMTSAVKFLSTDYSTVQIVWGRYVGHFLIVVAMLGSQLPTVLRPDRPATQIARSLMMFAATASSFLALRYLPLAEVAAIMFLTPIFVTALAALVLAEAVGIRRWSAVGVGFLGAVVIIRPGFEAVHPAVLAAIVCTVCYALYQIMTRVVGDTAPPFVSLFYSCLVGTVVSTLAVPFFWRTPDLMGWAILALSGAFGAAGHLAMIGALARAPASFVTPFSYSQLIWATIVGFWLFGELPDAWTFVGAGLIALSGLYVLHRERLRRTALARPVPPPGG